MDPLEKRLKTINAAVKQLRSIVSGKQKIVTPSTKVNRIVNRARKPRVPSTGVRLPKMPGIAPMSKKDPKKVAEQLKNPDLKAKAMQDIKLAKAVPAFKQPQKHDFDLPHADVTSPTTINANTHGMGHAINLTHDQRGLIHGLDMSAATPHKTEKHGAAGVAWNKNPHSGHEMIVKPASSVAEGRQDVLDTLGHFSPDGYNSARREVVFHNMAHNYFGLGHAVPTTAGFTHRGQDYSAQKKLNAHPLDSDSYENKQVPTEVQHKLGAALKHLNSTGELHKLAMMDFIMGNNDRHGGNYMVDKEKPQIHLIDNGLASDYDHKVKSTNGVPHYLSTVESVGVSKQPHPDAVKWLQSLSPKQAVKMWTKQGFSRRSPQVVGFLQRLQNLKEAVKGNKPTLSRMMMDAMARKTPISQTNYQHTVKPTV